ncbi:flagellar basal body P-ring formation chaperone FlgA [Marinobacteraceae bacterium S3BR75-40.1]
MRIFIVCILMIYPLLGLAQEGYTSSHAIRTQAKAYLQQFVQKQEALDRKVKFEVGTLDNRLRLAECQKTLEFSFTSDPLTRTANTLLVSCQGQRPWRLFLNIDIEIRDEAMVATTPLARGTRIQAGMLDKREVIVNAQRKSTYSSPKPLVGMLLKRSIGSGTVLSPDLLEAPDAVSRGDRVIISASSGPVVIETRGKALASGKIGEQVLVENLRSQRRIYGIVAAPGRVEVTM